MSNLATLEAEPTTAISETCDRCGPAVRALVRIRVLTGELTFCGHHYRTVEQSGTAHTVLADERT